MRYDVNGYVLAAKATHRTLGAVVGKLPTIGHRAITSHSGPPVLTLSKECVNSKGESGDSSTYQHGRVALKYAAYYTTLSQHTLRKSLSYRNPGSASVRSWLRWRMWQPL